MSIILLRDIMISARQECVQMRHFYIGVEHLFIALLQIQGGLASSILEEQGLTADYVIEAIRRKTDKGLSQVLWVGIPYTPRTDIVLNIAGDLALDNGHEEASERELLCAIMDEGESLPTRVLKSLNVDTEKFAESARTHTPAKEPQPPDIRVIFGEEFNSLETIQREQLFVLRRMFAAHSEIRIERRLTGFRGALILVVTPIHPDKRQDAPIVVKIDQVDNILDEVQRYEAHVKHALPLQTARLEDNPTTPEASELAGIKYTLIANSEDVPQDLRNRVQTEGSDGLGKIIQQGLYAQFSKTWWQQRRPFRFQVWKEYDWLLPPVLTLEFIPAKEPPENAHIVKIPFNRARLKAKLKEMQFGDVIALDNFTVQRVDRENNVLKLAIGYGSEADKRAYKIEVKGLNLAKNTYYRGEVVERLVGTVWKKRDEVLLDAARALEPYFDLDGRWILIGKNRIPNPLLAYEDLLDRHVNGSLSKIHGDLHLGNILVGPNHSTWLIDFAHTRDGHTLFDWASLEVSLLGDAVMPAEGDSWEGARKIITHIAALDSAKAFNFNKINGSTAFASVAAIRNIVRECLTNPDNWHEYYVALALCSLRAITWPLMSLGGRRLMFLLSGLAIYELNRKSHGSIQTDTPSPDETDMTDHLPTSVSWTSPNDTLQTLFPALEDLNVNEPPNPPGDMNLIELEDLFIPQETASTVLPADDEPDVGLE
jgi:hypothetical protein